MALESFVGCYFFVYGLSRSNLVLASILTSLAPVISVPVTVALKLEAFSWKRALGVVIVVLGLALLVADH
jgi:drug/metabolite transporter (DMT)-like permease